MNNKIFLVEDDPSICEMVGNYLISEDFSADIFHRGSDAVRTFQADSNYALALVDLMLPDMSGMEIIKEIRRTSTIPIIIVTAKDNDTDKTMGLNLGADDYVVKPFSLIELTARIKANIRRATRYGSQPEPVVIRIRDLEINPSSRTAEVAGTPLDLTRTEFEILHLLASHPGQAFSKERLYDLVWKEPYLGNENVLNTHINRLRAKLRKASNSNINGGNNGNGNSNDNTKDNTGDNTNGDTVYIKTLWGIGYKMEGE